MASFDPQDFGLDEPPPRPDTPPVRRGFLLVLLALTFLTGLVYGIPYMAERTGYAWEAGRSKAASEALAKLSEEGVINKASALFRMATTAVSPAVVNIQTQKFRKEAADVPGLPFGGGGRFNRGVESMGVGSGVIIDKDNGYIVTNNHVVQGADQITVRLSQGAELTARLVGADPKTDLAVLQIKSPVVKVAAEWGDSDKLSIGDWVLAIGSPYMLDHTVTAGIISATGRNNLPLPGMDEGAYQDFLQTDAAINPGNSGGPLIDLNGKIIGINTAILTSNSFLRGDDRMGQSGGFEGIGLAIPSAMAKRVVDGLIKNGRVVRGYLGVAIQPVVPENAKSLKLDDTRGALVTMVQPDSPAGRAGLRPGDVIVKLGDKEIADPAALRIRTADIAPGSEVAVEYFRDGERKSLAIVVGELGGPAVAAISPFGFRVVEIPPAPPERPEGVLVIDQVARGSAAARARLMPQIRIHAVGKTPVRTKVEFEKAAAEFNPQTGLPLQIELPNGQTAAVIVGGPDNPPGR